MCNFDIFELYFSTTSCSNSFLVRKNDIDSEACNSGRFKRFKKSMMISTMSAPYLPRLSSSDVSRATTAGNGLDLPVKFECDYSMKGGMNSFS